MAKGERIMARMFVYRIDPIDCWDGWSRWEERVDQPHGTWFAQALVLATKLGWEGDVRDGFFGAPLPDPDGGGWPPIFMLAWKQDNNGETFIASPKPLSWLVKDCLGCTSAPVWDEQTALERRAVVAPLLNVVKFKP